MKFHTQKHGTLTPVSPYANMASTPWVSSQQCKILMCFYRNHFDSTPICHFLAKTTQFGTDIWVFILDPHLEGQHLKMIMQISHSSEL